MKKVFSLMLLFATMLSFTACSGDDEPDYPSIVGTWFREYTTTSGNYTGTVEQTTTFRTDYTADAHMRVYMNGALMRDRVFNYTYQYNGKTLVLTSTESGEIQTFSVKISGNILSLTGKDGTSEYNRR